MTSMLDGSLHAERQTKTAITDNILVDNFKACVFLEYFRYNDSFVCLIVFEQSSDDSREGECAAVECVGELDVAVFIFEAQF